MVESKQCTWREQYKESRILGIQGQCEASIRREEKASGFCLGRIVSSSFATVAMVRLRGRTIEEEGERDLCDWT